MEHKEEMASWRRMVHQQPERMEEAANCQFQQVSFFPIILRINDRMFKMLFKNAFNN
jgi:hypothetical protein